MKIEQQGLASIDPAGKITFSLWVIDGEGLDMGSAGIAMCERVIENLKAEIDRLNATLKG